MAKAKKPTKVEETLELSASDLGQTESTVVETVSEPEVVAVKKAHIRSVKYHAAKRRVDRTKLYSPKEAAKLLKTTSYSKFAGTVVVDLIVRDEKLSVDVSFPHSTGKTLKVAIASDELISQIEAGNIDFDILVTSPAFMPKLAKFARVLGPKGLMPNPKNNTVSADPEKRAKELSNGKITIKTEKKAPLVHAIIGKSSMTETELKDNLEALLVAVNTNKIKKCVISSTMSPGIKVDFAKV